MHKRFTITIFSLLLLFAKDSLADQLRVPLQIDYGLIKKLLLSQLYTGKDHSAELWNDSQGCSYLRLANPELSGIKGQIQLLNQVQVRFGTSLNGQCLTLLEWSGVLETQQLPTLDSTHTQLSFPITSAIARDQSGRQLTIGKLQDLINRYAAPKLAAVKIDLNESKAHIEQTLEHFLPKDNAPEVKDTLRSLRFDTINVGDNSIAIALDFKAPKKTTSLKPAAAFSEAEQKRWQSSWRHWDEFLSSAIARAAVDANSPELGETLMGILADSREAFAAGLKDHDADGPDPVRVFFTDTWVRLSPALKIVAQQLPGMQSLRYLSFIAATDALYELENLGSPFGLDISSDGLRTLARILIADPQLNTP